MRLWRLLVNTAAESLLHALINPELNQPVPAVS